MSHADKKQYLLGKIVEGAKCLEELFDNAENKTFEQTEETARLAEKYSLTESQCKILRKAATSIASARKAIEKLKEIYGTNRKGYFINKQELFREAYGDKYLKGVSAKPGSFYICFTFPDKYFREHAFGDSMDLMENVGLMAYNLFRRIEKMQISDLTFRLNQEGIIKKHKPAKGANLLQILRLGFRCRDMIDRVYKHEKKHVIDKFLTVSKMMYVQELSAMLYSGGGVSHALSREIRIAKKRLAQSNAFYEECTSVAGKVPKSEMEIYLAMIMYPKLKAERDRTKLQLLNELSKQHIIGAASVIGERSLSYIVATTHLPKLMHRLELLKDYLKDSGSQK